MSIFCVELKPDAPGEEWDVMVQAIARLIRQEDERKMIEAIFHAFAARWPRMRARPS